MYERAKELWTLSFRTFPTVWNALRGAAAASGGSSSVTITRVRTLGELVVGRAGVSLCRTRGKDVSRSDSITGSRAPEAVPLETTTRTREAKSASRSTGLALADPRGEAPRGPEAFEDDRRRATELLALRVLRDEPRAGHRTGDDPRDLRSERRLADSPDAGDAAVPDHGVRVRARGRHLQ